MGSSTVSVVSVVVASVGDDDDDFHGQIGCCNDIQTP